MILITDSIKNFTIKDDYIKKSKGDFKGFILVPKNDFWNIEFVFSCNYKKYIREIYKTYAGGDSILKKYINLTPKLKNVITLTKEDYIEIERMFNKLLSLDNIKKKEIIELAAESFSFEYYQNYILEEDYQVSTNSLFNEYVEINASYKEYKKEIVKRSQEILKEKYLVNELKWIGDI